MAKDHFLALVISIAGQTLENGGVYPCLVANYPGIVLTNLVYNMMRFEQIARLRIVYPA